MKWSTRADAQAWEAAAEAISLVGGAPGEPGPALGSTNHVWLIDEPLMVVSVAATGRNEAELADRLVAARHLADLGIFPALIPDVGQPVRTRVGRLVTIWERIETVGSEPDWIQVGSMLRYLADTGTDWLGPDVKRLRAVDDLTDIPEQISRLSAAGRMSSEDARVLERVCDRLAAELESHPYNGPRVVVHGDLTPSNLLVTPKGAILCDPDELGIGPADWDITTLLDWRRLSSSGSSRQQLLEGWARPASPRLEGSPVGSTRGELASPGAKPGIPSSQSGDPSWFAEPRPERIRCLTRIGHLRRSLRHLGRYQSSLRDTYWDAVRMEGWRRVDRSWPYQAFPELYLSRPRQVKHVLTRAVTSSSRLIPGDGARKRSS